MRDTEMLERLRPVCDALVVEPMFTLSLGSKELFHSNLLGWLCERFPKQALSVLQPWLHARPNATRHRVRREFQHLDLVVELPGYAPLVIENKVFALPTRDQLERYTPNVVRHVGAQATLILLSLMDPGWQNGSLEVGGHTWRFVSWPELAVRITGAVTELGLDEGDGFEPLILTHEARLIQQLDSAIAATGITETSEQYTLPTRVLALLRRTRLAAAVGYARNHQAMAMIHAAYDEAGITPSRTEVGFSRGEPLLAAFWLGPDGNGVGWQLQSGQWRLAMILDTPDLRGVGRANARAAVAAAHPEWFDFSGLLTVLEVTDEQVSPRRARIPPTGFNKYDPNFVYRYRRLPAITTIQQVVDLAVAYGHAGQAWSFS